MKNKLLLPLVCLASLPYTTLADMGYPVEIEHNFYLKAYGGASIFNKVRDKATELKLKSKTKPFIGAGIGYYFPGNAARFDVAFDYYIDPQLQKSGAIKYIDRFGNPGTASATMKHKAQISSLMLNGYFDIFNIGLVTIFTGGGVGVARIKEKLYYYTAYPSGRTRNDTDFMKKSYNFAYSFTLGISFPIALNLNTDISYNWRDFGKTKSKVNEGFEIGKTLYRGHNLSAGFRLDL